ncbi:MAG: FkbM family methyltransferase [Selenomonadaceae bacterium]|nr:FkbM family methyltransferase [Selenomonadaceae bacterium]
MSAEFIKMISELHEERFNIHLEEMVKNQTPCGIFFGFIMVPSNAVKNIQSLTKTGLNVTCAIVLADVQANALRNFVDIPVITLEDLPRFGEESFSIVKLQEVFLTFKFSDFAFTPYFEQYGIEILTVSDSENFSSVMKHLSELYSVYEMLGSDESKKVFRAAIKGRLTGKISDYRFAPEAQYFLNGFYPKAGDIAIDGGAYDGGTAVEFSKLGAKVFAFEMDATNYKNCATRINKFNGDITLENLGLSDKAGKEKYFYFGTGSRKNSNGALTADFVDLDTYVAQKNLPRVDYIKLDIEGSELDMLHGAAKTITDFKPKMAVSAYHKPEDLWTLATYIKSLRTDYEFEFRHYKVDCTNYTMDDDERSVLRYLGLSYFVPSPYEMILYCK